MQIVMRDVEKEVGGKKLISGISLTMESGHVYGFTGDNGSGKTVLFKTLLGLMRRTSGQIFVDGEELTDLLGDVGFIIERPDFIPYYSAGKNLKVIADCKRKVDDERIREVISMFGLDPDEKLPVGKYSLGMKQKLALALAFLEDPSVLVLDEPLSALDEDSVDGARQIILKEKERGKLVLIASHYPEDISTLCDVIYRMKNGKIEEITKK